MRYSYLVLVFLLLACGTKHDLPVVMELQDSWEFRQVGDSIWRSASVPGNVFTDLLDHKMIEDPLIGTNEQEVQWVSETNWEYRTRFTLSNELQQKRFRELSFEGLDTYAKVYLNDSLILSANNAFRSWQVDVRSLLEEENELRIVFTSPSRVEQIEKLKLGYELPEGNRVFTRKPQFQYGWDWGPKLNVMGVWRPVSLRLHDEVRIDNLYIEKLEVSQQLARFNCILDLRHHRTSGYTFELFVNDSLAAISDEGFQYAPNTVPFEINNPKLWWPHNIGDPFLYDIKVVVKDGNTILDSIATKYGIREVELVTQPDSLGESFYFRVNGEPVYAKGANYIPQHSFQNTVIESDYERLLNDVVDANMNMLRVWGGGIYEEDQFYELCDKKGIMVWQDFMFACAMYPGDQAFLNNVHQEAIDNVTRLRNHPSIVLWCGNNENSEGWHRWGWQDGRSEAEKEEIWNNYLKVFDSILPRVVGNYTDVDYWESSPKFGRGNPQYQFEGDAHDWWVWHDGYPFEHFESQVPRFMSEFGFQSFPSSEVIRKINNSDTLDLNTEAIRNHQKHSKGFQLMKEYMARDFPVPDDPEGYIYMSQLVQAYGITKGIESHRRAKPYNMGSLFWQLNDCWPAISWSSIDHLGNRKALHYKAQNSFKNLILSPKLIGNQLEVWIVNDALQSHTEELSLEVLDFRGNIVWKESTRVEIKANSSELKKIINIGDMEIDPSSVVLQASLKEDTTLFYLSKPKNLSLSQGDINTRVKKTDDGFTVELLSKTFQKDVFVSTSLRGNFSDNFFDLLPNQSKRIHFETSENVLKDFQIKSFNNFIR